MPEPAAGERIKRLLEEVERLRAELAKSTAEQGLERLRQSEKPAGVLLSLGSRKLSTDPGGAPAPRSPEPPIVFCAIFGLLVFLLLVPHLVPTHVPVHYIFLVIGSVFGAVALAFAYRKVGNNRLQCCFLSVIMALAAAMVASALPGYLNVDLPNHVTAGGALGVFALVLYLLLKYAILDAGE